MEIQLTLRSPDGRKTETFSFDESDLPILIGQSSKVDDPVQTRRRGVSELFFPPSRTNDAPSNSGADCHIDQKDDQLFIKKLDSSIEVSVDGVGISKAPIENSSQFEIGNWTLTIELPEQDSAEDSPKTNRNPSKKRIRKTKSASANESVSSYRSQKQSPSSSSSFSSYLLSFVLGFSAFVGVFFLFQENWKSFLSGRNKDINFNVEEFTSATEQSPEPFPSSPPSPWKRSDDRTYTRNLKTYQTILNRELQLPPPFQSQNEKRKWSKLQSQIDQLRSNVSEMNRDHSVEGIQPLLRKLKQTRNHYKNRLQIARKTITTKKQLQKRLQKELARKRRIEKKQKQEKQEDTRTDQLPYRKKQVPLTPRLDIIQVKGKDPFLGQLLAIDQKTVLVRGKRSDRLFRIPLKKLKRPELIRDEESQYGIHVRSRYKHPGRTKYRDLDPSEVEKQFQKLNEQFKNETNTETKKKRNQLKEKFDIQNIETMVFRGDHVKRVDVVFMSDGWTKEELSEYRKICKRLIDKILKVKPFSNYPEYINFHRLDIVEEESGIQSETALQTTIRGNAIMANPRIAQKYKNLIPSSDLSVVVANTKKQVRATAESNSRTITLPRSGQIGPTAIHELGHAFGQLDDEYVDSSRAKRKPGYGPEEEDEHINTTRVSDPKTVKWHYWNFPKPPKNWNIGAYEGAFYRSEGYYRPARNCRMRNSSFKKFCPICFEQMERTFFKYLSPIDRVSPLQKNTFVDTKSNSSYSVEAVSLPNLNEGRPIGEFKVGWFYNGKKLSHFNVDGLKSTVSASNLSREDGKSTLVAKVHFLNPRVRRGQGFFSSTHFWNLRFSPSQNWNVKYPINNKGVPGKTITIELDKEGFTPEKWSIIPLVHPPGAQFSRKKQTFQWTPESSQTGAFLFRTGLVKKQTKTEKTNRNSISFGNEITPHGLSNAHNWSVISRDQKIIRVPTEPEENQKPKIRFPKEITVETGSAIQKQIHAYDPNGDALVFQGKNLPEGCRIDPVTGKLYWRPNVQLDQKSMNGTITAHDGHYTTRQTVKFRIRESPFRLGPHSGSQELRIALAHSDATIRRNAINRLSNTPKSFRLLAYLRLLRDPEEEIRKHARGKLRNLIQNLKEENVPKWINTIFWNLQFFVYDFTDSPETLKFIKTVLEKTNPTQLSNSRVFNRVQKKLKHVRSYNKRRKR